MCGCVWVRVGACGWVGARARVRAHFCLLLGKSVHSQQKEGYMGVEQPHWATREQIQDQELGGCLSSHML